jgi:trk system potassium uptake protein
MQHSPQNNISYQQRPGDKVYRVPRLQPLRIILPKIRPKRPLGFSLLTLVYGFAAMIALGTVLLILPISSNSGESTNFVNCLFTSTSAVCVTGLVVVDTLEHWSIFGQVVILVLIQFGGLGFMTVTTVLLMAAGRRIGLRGRLLLTESVGVSGMGGIVRLTRNILFFTLIAEFAGAIIFFVRFSDQYTWPMAIWKSIFQSVSAFNNAGFDLFGGFRSLSGYHSDYLVVLTTSALIILGGISFVAVNNIFRSRGLHTSSVDTKLVLLITVILLLLGSVVFLVVEFGNPGTLGNLPLSEKILNAFFQSVTTRTAGFNTFNTGALSSYALYFTMILMFIGGAAGSTAGGIKVNTFGMIITTIWNTIRGTEHPGIFGREFPVQQIFRGMALLVLSFGIIVIVFLILSFTDHFPSIKILFETISAFGTVGLSTGITPTLSTTGKIFIIIMMFIGRLGPLTLTMALAKAQRNSQFRYPQESIRIG